jgi:hypothetical protein
MPWAPLSVVKPSIPSVIAAIALGLSGLVISII